MTPMPNTHKYTHVHSHPHPPTHLQLVWLLPDDTQHSTLALFGAWLATLQRWLQADLQVATRKEYTATHSQLKAHLQTPTTHAQ